MKNLFEKSPNNLTEEMVETLVQSKNARIERIVSHGQSSPPEGWYDQDENEWVLLAAGSAVLEFEDRKQELSPGDYVLIPADQKHRVASTSLSEKTIWLAVFFN